MKIAVVSCLKYQDAWKPFLALFRKFWPDCRHEVLFITDKDSPGKSWCRVVSDFAGTCTQSILLMQEDFFLNAPAQGHLVEHALHIMKREGAAMVRLYPCPGANESIGDTHFGRITKGTRYRVSCQASIWNPAILCEIASHCETPAEFELNGTPLSDKFGEPFLSFRREMPTWPLSYFCSAISRGKWEPAAVEFCRREGIELDLSRGVYVH